MCRLVKASGGQTEIGGEEIVHGSRHVVCSLHGKRVCMRFYGRGHDAIGRRIGRAVVAGRRPCHGGVVELFDLCAKGVQLALDSLRTRELSHQSRGETQLAGHKVEEMVVCFAACAFAMCALCVEFVDVCMGGLVGGELFVRMAGGAVDEGAEVGFVAFGERGVGDVAENVDVGDEGGKGVD